MKKLNFEYKPKSDNHTSRYYDYERRESVTRSEKCDLTIIGSLSPPHTLDQSDQKTTRASIDLTIVHSNHNRYAWGVSTFCSERFPSIWDAENRRRIRQSEDSIRTSCTSHATSEKLYYRRTHMLPGLEYDAHSRKIWNPLRDDVIAKLVEFEENEKLQAWLTRAYIKLRPDLKIYFESTRPHTPPMARMAFDYPGFRVLVAGGWIPTFPFSHARGMFRTVLSQPNPKRMLNYIYGSYSKDNFKHMKTYMDLPNSWFMIMLARLGREIFHSEWIKEIELTDSEAYPRLDLDVSDVKLYRYLAAFRNTKPKKLLALFQDAARSPDNIELFFDTFRMSGNLLTHGRNNEGVDVWAQIDTRHIDELHTRTVELYNARFANAYRYGYSGMNRHWQPADKLKPAKALLDIQDSQIAPNMTLRVAEEACEVADWGQQQQHCIASYIPNAKRGTTTLLGIYRDKQIYANASVSNGKVTQLRGRANKSIEPEEAQLIKTVVEGAFVSQDNSGKTDRNLAHA